MTISVDCHWYVCVTHTGIYIIIANVSTVQSWYSAWFDPNQRHTEHNISSFLLQYIPDRSA